MAAVKMYLERACAAKTYQMGKGRHLADPWEGGLEGGLKVFVGAMSMK